MANKFAGGFNSGMNMNNLMKKAQKMQQDMLNLQNELKEREYTASSGGGIVTATVNGSHELISLEIKPEACDAEDIELLQDMIIAAVNAASGEAEETTTAEMAKITGGASVPGLF